ncbi:conserved hypothetical protein [Cupriavidus phytorum]|uniref:Uncharacterized protein n=2 Tax=Cupriavidus TaxID=106589 RepID=A0A375BDZ5_9BURK|nr:MULTISPECIES: hypothetical protein [Cupriavidus]PZX27960.1 hypothetical protein C7416_105188 [Cupriavidus alkaliphilus]SOY41856.1 conserved hypothetical protein [Cupriavidus taiwanensis]
MSARANPPLPDFAFRARHPWRGAAACAALGALLLAAGCAQIPRDANGSPPTARLAPNAIPPAPLNAEDRQRLDELNQQVLRDQAAAIALDQQAAAARYAYPNTSWNLFYGGWGGGGWGGGVSVGMPGWGWGGYPYGWW